MGILRNIMDLSADQLMTEKVKAFKSVPFAQNEKSEVYADLIDINDYKFLTLKILGPLNIKTIKGCHTFFETSNGERISVEADTMEIETDFSKKLSLGITKYDIELNPDLEALINKNEIRLLTITFDNSTEKFEVNNIAELVRIINSPPVDGGDELDSLSDTMGNSDPYPYK